MLIDTDVLIDIVRKHPSALRWFTTLAETPLVSGYSAMEFVNGCRDKEELRRAQKFILAFPLVWPELADLERALSDYAPKGLSHGVGVIDARVAATAVGNELPLATFNVKHFQALPNIKFIKPYSR